MSESRATHPHSHGHAHADGHQSHGHGHGHGHAPGGHGIGHGEDMWSGEEYVNRPGVKETAVISHDSVVYALSQAGLSSENMARMDVVEIGCGGGAVTQHLAKSFKTIHAIDTSPSMLLTFSKNLPVNNPNITYSLHFISPDSADTFAKREPMFSPTNDQTLGGNERKIPPPRARFDLAVANLVVHHIDDLDSFTRGVVGLLNPGGWVVLTEFGKREGEETDGLYTRVGKADDHGSVHKPGHYHPAFDHKTLSDLLTKHGFVNVWTEIRGILPVFGDPATRPPCLIVRAQKPQVSV